MLIISSGSQGSDLWKAQSLSSSYLLIGHTSVHKRAWHHHPSLRMIKKAGRGGARGRGQLEFSARGVLEKPDLKSRRSQETYFSLPEHRCFHRRAVGRKWLPAGNEGRRWWRAAILWSWFSSLLRPTGPFIGCPAPNAASFCKKGQMHLCLFSGCALTQPPWDTQVLPKSTQHTLNGI